MNKNHLVSFFLYIFTDDKLLVLCNIADLCWAVPALGVLEQHPGNIPI
jgi:hypothetical protein